MTVNRIRQFLIALSLIALGSGITIGQQVEQKAQVIENASQAVERALAFTGFKISKDYSLTQVAEEIAKLEVAELASFPFLVDQINGTQTSGGNR